MEKKDRKKVRVSKFQEREVKAFLSFESSACEKSKKCPLDPFLETSSKTKRIHKPGFFIIWGFGEGFHISYISYMKPK